MKKNIILCFIFMIATNAFSFNYWNIAGQVDISRVKNNVEYFSNLGSRVCGYEGERKAAEYIISELKNLGLEVRVQEFDVVVPKDKGASLKVISSNRILTLHSLWPNGVRTSTLPEEGLDGLLIYGGNGNLENLNGKEIKGSIVLLNFNSGANWLNLAMLGAKAIVFIQPQKTNRTEAGKTFTTVPVNVPRFYIKSNEAKILISEINKNKEKEIPVHLKARMEWEKVQSKNIFATLPGRDKKLKDETVVIQSFYDAISVVPSIAPGAENSTGISALLEIARILKNNPPKRNVIFLANSAHFITRKGIFAFINEFARTDKYFKDKIKNPIKISLFIGLDLSSHSDELVVWHNSEDFYHQRYLAPLGKKFIDYAQEICNSLGYKISNTFSNGITAEKGISFSSLIPVKIMADGEVPLKAGNPSISIITAHDARMLVDTPLDKAEYINYGNLEKQIKFLSCLLKKAIDEEEIFPKLAMELRDLLRGLRGEIVSFDPRESFVPDKPIKGAVTEIIMSQEKAVAGVRTTYFNITDEKGRYFELFPTVTAVEIHAYVLDKDGNIVYAPDRGVNGAENYPMKAWIDWWEKAQITVLFPCVPIDIFELIDPRYLTSMNRIDIFNINNSLPYAYGYTFIDQKIPVWIGATSLSEPVAVIFTHPQEKIKIAFGTGALGMRQLLLNSPGSKKKSLSEGVGFEPTVKNIANTPFQAAKDMYNLDEFRITQLYKYGISNARLLELHQESAKFLKESEKAKEEKRWDDFVRYSRRSAGLESRAYPDVKGTMNDVISGVIFYMFLILPFSFLFERLVFGFSDIRKQIVAVFGIFLATYLVLRLVHPAFSLTFAAEIILLAFILLALSLLVISFVSGKFEELMKKRKRETLKVEEAEISRASVLSRAFSLGVSNMKRRKMRTFLTALTLILLTFTVLSFTSVRAYLKFYQIYRSNVPPYQGMLIRDRVWFPLEEKTCEYLKEDFSKENTIISSRSWFIVRTKGEKTNFKIRYQDNSFYASGLVGLEPAEREITGVDKSLIRGRWFEQGEENVCIIPEEMAKLLKINLEEAGKAKVKLFGEEFLIIGVFDSKKFNQFKDIDDEALTPAEFMGTMEEMHGKTLQEKRGGGYQAEKAKIESFLHTDGANIIILPYQQVVNSGGTIQSIAIKFIDEKDLKEKIENFVSRLALTVFAGIGNNSIVYSSLSGTSFSGLTNLLIPIIVVALIVLNTMMGSVYERFREVGTYSALGLAPTHISMLFIAEACVYAIVGGICGYLLGQIIAKIFTVTGTLSGLTLNYSSLSAVSSTLMVMAVVFLSTIYPANKASKMAVPDVTRKWKIPAPVGDDWRFDFPFTVSEKEVLGLFVFLRNYFASYTEESIGDFYTEDTHFETFELEGREEKGYLIKMNVWIAPFDLGVSQKIELRATPTEDKGIYLIVVFINRMSGEGEDWKRLNRHFLNCLRKQFLVWRTIAEQTKEEYREEGRKFLFKENTR